MHFPRPVSRYWREIQPAAFRRGTADFARAYGLLFEALEMAYVHGFAYRRVTPLAEAELPERFRRAEEVFAQKFWRQQLQDWNDAVKPAAIAAHRQIQAVDPDALSDDDLAGYLQRCHRSHGDFLAHAGAWTGLPAAELLGLMRGSSPVSAGASHELAELVTALQQDPPARETLQTTDDHAADMEALRTRDGRTGLAMAAYLDLVGNRLLDGFDITNPRALELPDVLLRGLAVSPGVYEGPVRRVLHPSEFDRIQKGDVLVTQSTTEAFNILLPLLGEIVTDRGGLLSHSAIVAREYGIPGVVGTREASRRARDSPSPERSWTRWPPPVLPASTRPSSMCPRWASWRKPCARSGGRRIPTPPSPTARRWGCSPARAWGWWCRSC